MLILDCCRDDPLTRSWRNTRSNNAGLVDLKDTDIPDSTMILFSAAPGQVALDGEGRNSPFTAALIEELPKPGIDALAAFFRVSDTVFKRTSNLQEPWVKFDGAGRSFREFQFAVGFTNILGMKFLPVEGTDVLFCEHETRVKDYAQYVAEVKSVDMSWKAYDGGDKQGPYHPVVDVSWEDAKGFCVWLSKKEGLQYRLPTDHEWSVAVGIGDQEDPAESPKAKHLKVGGYPWGNEWPPPKGVGHYYLSELDTYKIAAPVKSFKRNEKGLYDLGGNVREWCEDWYSKEQSYRVLRDGIWSDGSEKSLRSSCRFIEAPENRSSANGFRLVVDLSS
ncbi:MAG: SUMF1/EgtB/PvdO family nonheme iron enzyme [Verrucomicrobiota bacterium]